MLYLPVLSFAILAIIKTFQGQWSECVLFIMLAGVYLIPATIQHVYEEWLKKKALEYKTISEILEKFGKDSQKKAKEQEK